MKDEKNRVRSHGHEDEPKGGCPGARGVNRREFLGVMGVAAVGAAASGIVGCDDSNNGGTGTVHQLTPPTTPLGSAKVAVVGGASRSSGASEIHAAVSRAIALAGGLNTILQGQTVVIKPNLTYQSAEICTHVEVIRGVIKEVKKRTAAANITVADRSAFTSGTQQVADAIGLTAVLKEEGVNLLPWDDGEWVEATSASFKHIEYNLKVPKTLIDGTFDHFINVPILKNHEMVAGANADFTCCLKAHVGVVHPDSRLGGSDTWMSGGIHTADLGEKVAELNLVAPIHTMEVVDALTIVLTNGPGSGGEYANANLILASKDRVACDSVAVAVLRYHAKLKNIDKPYVNKSVWAQASIVRARELKLGRGPEDIEISPENVAEIEAITKLWA